eukprot:SAG31_NODE_7318_length_1720_cov_2.404688_1_plen_97_part_10
MLWEAGALTCKGLVVALGPAREQRCSDRVGVRVIIADIEAAFLPTGLLNAVASGVPGRDDQFSVDGREAAPTALGFADRAANAAPSAQSSVDGNGGD